jgi:hypothetical protein
MVHAIRIFGPGGLLVTRLKRASVYHCFRDIQSKTLNLWVGSTPVVELFLI